MIDATTLSETYTDIGGNMRTRSVPDMAKRASATQEAGTLREQAKLKKAQAAALRAQMAALDAGAAKLNNTIAQTNTFMRNLAERVQQTDLHYAKQMGTISEATLAYINKIKALYHSFSETSLDIGEGSLAGLPSSNNPHDNPLTGKVPNSSYYDQWMQMNEQMKKNASADSEQCKGGLLTATYLFKFDPEPWKVPYASSNSEYKDYINCYTYAFNMWDDPITRDFFPAYGMQPGYLSGQLNGSTKKELKAHMKKYFAGTDESNKALVSLIKDDAKAVGLDFIPYQEGLKDGYKVALAVQKGEDYHFYRENGDGTWSHKRGQLPERSYELADQNFLDSFFNPELVPITDPQSNAKKYGYNVFIGEFYIKRHEGEK